MNRKFIPAVAALMIFGMLLSVIPLSYAQTYAIGPMLNVVTIAEDNPLLSTGVMILGINPGLGGTGTTPSAYTTLLAQYKLIITYNGETLTWAVGTPGPSVTCNILEKDKVNVQPNPKTGLGKQGSWENLMTTLVDVSNKFVCKPRWKSPATGVLESVGALDVYYVGPTPAPAATNSVTGVVITPAVTNAAVGVWIADNIVTVEAFITAGRTVVFGSDIQDLCTLGWAINNANPANAVDPTWLITKPDGTTHSVWQNAMGNFHSCESLALAQRNVLGIALAAGPDPLSPV
jgi:hypothetical protein